MPEDKAEKPKEKRINVPLSPELHRRLKMKAAEEGTDLQKLVAKLLSEALMPQQGNKGGAVYPVGGTRAPVFADGQR
jgi:hypothetical protein